jgi:hypothetical protein
MHCATLSADPPQRQRIGLSEEMGGRFTEPKWQEATSPDGVKYFVTRFHDQKPTPERSAAASIPSDLSIPDFLKRVRA